MNNRVETRKNLPLVSSLLGVPLLFAQRQKQDLYVMVDRTYFIVRAPFLHAWHDVQYTDKKGWNNKHHATPSV